MAEDCVVQEAIPHDDLGSSLQSIEHTRIYFSRLIFTEAHGADRRHHHCAQNTCEDTELREWCILSHMVRKKMDQDSNSASSFTAFQMVARCLLGCIAQISSMDMDPCPLQTESSKQTQVFICNPYKTKLPSVPGVSTASLPKKHALTSKKEF